MPLFLAPLVAGIFSGISAFLASRGAWLLAGLGVGLVVTKGMQTIAGFVIGDMQQIIATMPTGGGSGTGGINAGHYMIQMSAYVGLFDALNIVLGAFMAAYGLVGLRVILSRLS